MSDTPLSIEQLADLKIAIEKRNNEFRALNEEFTQKTNELENKKNEHIRLTAEVETLVAHKEGLIKENEDLRSEKSVINAEFNKKSEEQYKELREREERVSSLDQTTQLRILEVDKRERDIAGREQALEAKAIRVRLIESDAKNESAKIDLRNEELNRREEEISKKAREAQEQSQKAIDERIQTEAKLEELKEKEREIEKVSRDNASSIIELKSKIAENEALEGRLSKIIPLYDELKTFIIGNVKSDDFEKKFEAFVSEVIERENAKLEVVATEEEVPGEITWEVPGEPKLPEDEDELETDEQRIKREALEAEKLLAQKVTDETNGNTELSPYDALKQPELKEELTKRGIQFPAGIVKNDVLKALLIEDDNKNKQPQ